MFAGAYTCWNLLPTCQPFLGCSLLFLQIASSGGSAWSQLFEAALIIIMFVVFQISEVILLCLEKFHTSFEISQHKNAFSFSTTNLFYSSTPFLMKVQGAVLAFVSAFTICFSFFVSIWCRYLLDMLPYLIALQWKSYTFTLLNFFLIFV